MADPQSSTNAALLSAIEGLRDDLRQDRQAAAEDRQAFRVEVLRIHERIDGVQAAVSVAAQPGPHPALEQKPTTLWRMLAKALNPDRIFIVLLLVTILIILGKMNLANLTP